MVRLHFSLKSHRKSTDTIRCGQGVISYYFSPLLTSLDVTGTNQQTGINGGMQVWNFIVSIAGALLADRIGRRSLWMVSLVAMICSNIGITVTSAVHANADNNKPAAYMAIVSYLPSHASSQFS